LLHRLVEILLTLLWHPAAKPMPNRAGGRNAAPLECSGLTENLCPF
jgi:hypothetical protein